MKLRAFFLLAVVVPLSASLANAETIGEALNGCKQTDNSLKRLMCYDKVVKQMNQYDGVSAGLPQTSLGAIAPVKRTASTRPVAAANADVMPKKQKSATEFGLEHKQDLDKKDADMAVSIASLTKNLRDKYVITFNNGTVWQQTDQTYLKIKEGQNVTVERGVLGAFYLSVEGLNKRMKVKRLK
ncbi:hypothetical protein [Alteromonas sp. A079]|uniref:hypothetical protein n=1 Tax=Alteromonas sp. A079 TaxID=3410268 RepID=UPI003BA1CE7A